MMCLLRIRWWFYTTSIPLSHLKERFPHLVHTQIAFVPKMSLAGFFLPKAGFKQDSDFLEQLGLLSY